MQKASEIRTFHSLYMPISVRDALQRLADDEGRSWNNMVLTILRTHLATLPPLVSTQHTQEKAEV